MGENKPPCCERAAYKKPSEGMSSNPGRHSQKPASADYFGLTEGSPPGLPGGGMTGVLPVLGVCAGIAGSIPGGGQSTPSDLASLSPKGSRLCPVVVASGAIVPWDGTGCVCAQPFEPLAVGGGTISVDGLAADGACAATAPQPAIHRQVMARTGLIHMDRQRRSRPDVPRKNAADQDL
jgi:hypothetical protein